jgi:hypothetical protein
MSYLSAVRLHFAGTFRANPATVNNDVRHFNLETFKDRYQEPQVSGGDWNGWWNPRGSNTFRLSECRVTRLYYADGTQPPSAASDPVAGMLLRDAEDRPSAKIVDLDPEQQFVTEIWGLGINITDGRRRAIKGEFVPASFSDMWWVRRTPFYQSIISPVEIDRSIESRFLRELMEESDDDALSMKFVVDRYGARGFTYGRIYGTIGPYRSHEPRHFVAGRYLRPPSPNPNDATNVVYFLPAVLDRSMNKVRLDFGNALRTSNDAIVDIGDLFFGHLDESGAFVPLDTVRYRDQNWYEDTAGICELPEARELTEGEIAAISSHPLALAQMDMTGRFNVAASENRQGLFVRADKFAFRVNPGDDQQVRLFATRFGEPARNIQIVAIPTVENFGRGSIGDTDEPDLPPQPPSGVPAEAVSYLRISNTDSHGVATVNVSTRDPGKARFLDGQLYGVAFYPVDALVDDGPNLTVDRDYRHNPHHALSILVWSATPEVESPTWTRDIKPIFELYANLYPVMKGMINLKEYEYVVENRKIIAMTMMLDQTHPNYMPVTRDLSRAKRELVLRWLDSKGADGLPPRGEPVMTAEAQEVTPIPRTPPSVRNFIPVPQAKVTPITASRDLKLTRDFSPIS